MSEYRISVESCTDSCVIPSEIFIRSRQAEPSLFALINMTIPTCPYPPQLQVASFGKEPAAAHRFLQ